MAGPWDKYQPATIENATGKEGPWAKYKVVAPDPTEGMSEWEKAKAGAGASLARIGRGVGQLVGLSTPADEAEARKLEAPLMASGRTELPPIQSGQHGIHPADRPNRVIGGSGSAGAAVGAVLPIAAASTLVPGANTILGSAALGGATGALQPVVDGESRTENAALGIAAGGGSAAALKGAGAIASKVLKSGQAKGVAEASRNSVNDATLKAAQAEGYVTPPSAAGGGSGSKLLESVGGKAATSQEAAIRNQQVTNKIARREAGLADDAPISERTLDQARDSIAAPYKEVASLSPRASKALEEMKIARNESKLHWKEYDASQKVAALKEAQRLDAKAAAYEKVIDTEAKRLGRPDLLTELKDARVRLAKNYDVERALNYGNGNVDARIIGRILDKRGEDGLTGGLLTVGKFAEAFSPYAREASGIATPGVSKLAPYGSVLLGSLGAGASEYTTGTPYGAAAAALPLLAGPARSMALSRMMQPRPSYGPGMTSRLADLATNSPRLRAILPASVVANTEQQ